MTEIARLTHRVDKAQIRLSILLPHFFGLRMWSTIKLLQLAGLIAPVTIEVEIKDD